MKIGFDLDGVTYPFHQSVAHYIKEHKKDERHLEEVKTWHFPMQQWGFSDKEWYQIFDDGVDDEIIFLFGDPLFDAAKVFKNLRKKGHTVHIITYRFQGTKAEYNTVRWLRKHEIRYDSLTFSKDKSLLKLDFMIDDSLDYHKNAIANGVNCYLLDRPWNQHESVPNRIYSVDEYLQIIKNAGK